MLKYKVGDTVTLQGKSARVVWLRENPSEIEAMDEYMVEFEDKQRRFFIASQLGLGLQHAESVEYRENNRNSC